MFDWLSNLDHDLTILHNRLGVIRHVLRLTIARSHTFTRTANNESGLPPTILGLEDFQGFKIVWEMG